MIKINANEDYFNCCAPCNYHHFAPQHFKTILKQNLWSKSSMKTNAKLVKEAQQKQLKGESKAANHTVCLIWSKSHKTPVSMLPACSVAMNHLAYCHIDQPFLLKLIMFVYLCLYIPLYLYLFAFVTSEQLV